MSSSALDTTDILAVKHLTSIEVADMLLFHYTALV
jgi:hypothetical protein